MKLREKSAIHTWLEDMDPNTFTGFEEFISSMGTWFEERTSSMELECLKIVGFQRHWKGGRSESGGRWKGWWRWEVIATNEEEVRDEASVNKSPTKFSSPFPCSFSLIFSSLFFKAMFGSGKFEGKYKGKKI